MLDSDNSLWYHEPVNNERKTIIMKKKYMITDEEFEAFMHSLEEECKNEQKRNNRKTAVMEAETDDFLVELNEA